MKNWGRGAEIMNIKCWNERKKDEEEKKRKLLPKQMEKPCMHSDTHTLIWCFKRTGVGATHACYTLHAWITVF